MKPRTHTLKTLAEAWDAIESGDKTFEVRRNDRFFQTGDTVILQRWGYDHSLTGSGRLTPTMDGHGFSAKVKSLKRRIGWMLQGGQYGIEPGYCVFSLEPAHD